MTDQSVPSFTLKEETHTEVVVHEDGYVVIAQPGVSDDSAVFLSPRQLKEIVAQIRKMKPKGTN